MSIKHKSQLSADYELLTQLIGNFSKAYLSNVGVSEAANALVGKMRALGLHYGHSVKSRRGPQPVSMEKSLHKLDTFLAEQMVAALLNFSSHLVSTFKARKPFMLVSKATLSCEEALKSMNGCLVKRWVPGTITNSASVFPSYKRKYGIQITKRPQVVISLIPTMYKVISAEVAKSSLLNVTFLSAVDSDILIKNRLDTCHFFVNDESVFFLHLFDTLISSFAVKLSLPTEPK